MTSILKILAAVSDSGRDNNILFTDLQRLLDYFGFEHRAKGSHFIYWHDDVEEIINIQSDGNKAKAYQVKQVRNIIGNTDCTKNIRRLIDGQIQQDNLLVR